MAFVLLFSQESEQNSESQMKAFTSELINDVLKLKGTFYLPYRIHYDFSQLKQAYPNINEFVEAKRRHDKDLLFQSKWWRFLESSSFMQ